jgi:hypothetical protein
VTGTLWQQEQRGTDRLDLLPEREQRGEWCQLASPLAAVVVRQRRGRDFMVTNVRRAGRRSGARGDYSDTVLHSHPVGEIEVTGDALELPGEDLTLIAYTAEAGSHAQQQLDFLASWSASPSEHQHDRRGNS